MVAGCAAHAQVAPVVRAAARAQDAPLLTAEKHAHMQEPPSHQTRSSSLKCACSRDGGSVCPFHLRALASRQLAGCGAPAQARGEPVPPGGQRAHQQPAGGPAQRHAGAAGGAAGAARVGAAAGGRGGGGLPAAHDGGALSPAFCLGAHPPLPTDAHAPRATPSRASTRPQTHAHRSTRCCTRPSCWTPTRRRTCASSTCGSTTTSSWAATWSWAASARRRRPGRARSAAPLRRDLPLRAPLSRTHDVFSRCCCGSSSLCRTLRALPGATAPRPPHQTPPRPDRSTPRVAAAERERERERYCNGHCSALKCRYR